MRVLKLKSTLVKWNEAYRKGLPIVPDIVYDNKLDELKSIVSEEDYLEFRKFLFEHPGKFKHRFKIGSLEKVKYEEPESLLKWIDKNNVKKLVVTEKLDGNSIVLYYDENGNIFSATTRGNGVFGENKIDKLLDIFPYNVGIHNLVIRGELIIHKNDFEWIKQNFKEYVDAKNPRNLVAGLLHKDEVHPDILKKIKFYAFQILDMANMSIIGFNQQDHLSMLKEKGFKVPNYTIIEVNENINEELKEFYETSKQNSSYEVDGLVLTNFDNYFEDELIPKNKIAFKVNQEIAITKVLDIYWNATKTGKIVPLIKIQPVHLNGTTVENVTGHNWKYVIENNISIGSTIEIFKSGEIIPKIKRVLLCEQDIIYPTRCPICNFELEIENDTHLVCPNKECDAKTKGIVGELLRRLGVKGISDNLLDKWGIDSLDKLINFKPNEKYKLELTLKSELDKKLFTKTKEELFLTYPFDDLGKITLTKILDYYHLENILKIDTELPKNYPDGVKEKTIQKLVEQINEFKIFLNLVTSSPSYNPIIKENNIQIDNKLLNKTFCVTGTLSMSRKDIEKLIVDNGGIIKGISRNLDYLIVGENPGTKLDKAKELGIKIINERELIKMIGG